MAKGIKAGFDTVNFDDLRSCQHCTIAFFPAHRRGRPRRHCSSACRIAAYSATAQQKRRSERERTEAELNP